MLIYNYKLSVVRTSDVEQLIYLPTPSIKGQVNINYFTLINHTSALTLTTFGIIQSANKGYLKSIASQAANYVDGVMNPFIIDNNTGLFVSVTGGNTGDKLEISVFGFYTNIG